MPEYGSSLMPPSTLQAETVTHSHIQTERKADYPKSRLINTQSLKHHGRNANFLQLSHGKSNSVLEATTQGHFYQTPGEDLPPAAVSLHWREKELFQLRCGCFTVSCFVASTLSLSSSQEPKMSDISIRKDIVSLLMLSLSASFMDSFHCFRHKTDD